MMAWLLLLLFIAACFCALRYFEAHMSHGRLMNYIADVQLGRGVPLVPGGRSRIEASQALASEQEVLWRFLTLVTSAALGVALIVRWLE